MSVLPADDESPELNSTPMKYLLSTRHRCEIPKRNHQPKDFALMAFWLTTAALVETQVHTRILVWTAGLMHEIESRGRFKVVRKDFSCCRICLWIC